MVREENKAYKTLYGSHTNNVCAWCGFHKVYLTTKQLRSKACLKKQCDALVKMEDHPLWEQRKNKHLRCSGRVR